MGEKFGRVELKREGVECCQSIYKQPVVIEQDLPLLKSVLINAQESDGVDQNLTKSMLVDTLNSDMLSPSQRFFVKNGAGYHLIPRSPNYLRDSTDHFAYFNLSGNVSTPTQHNHNNITFRSDQFHQSDRCEIRMLKTVASAYMKLYENAEPSRSAIERAHAVKKYFFEWVVTVCGAPSACETDSQIESSKPSGSPFAYPLNRLNKALVFTEVDGKVVIGMSEDRNKYQDKEVRQALCNLVDIINKQQTRYQFFLAAQPTNEEYYILRDLLQNHSLTGGSSYLPMMHYLSDMRARCAEVAVVYTLHKMGLASVIQDGSNDNDRVADRHIYFNFALVATSGALFGDAECKTLSPRFGGGVNSVNRMKYTTGVTPLGRGDVFIADWKMCSEHCAPLSKVLYIIPICSKILGGLKFETCER